MTSLSRRKHQTTAPNHPHPIHRDESCAGRNAFVQRLKRLAIGGVLIAGSAVTGLTTAAAQDHVQAAHRPRLLRTPVHATQNSPEQSAAGTSSALIRMKRHESPSQTAAQLSPYNDIQVPENPLRPRVNSLKQNRTVADGDRRTDDISRSVSEILGANDLMTRVRQASALQEIEFDEFDESDVEIIELEPGDSSEGWQERRHVKEVVTPLPLKLSAARNEEVVEPKDDPFGDSAQSVLKGPSRNQSVSYPTRQVQEDDTEENGTGESGEEIDLGLPRPDRDRDTDRDRDALPPKRNQDRQFEANCEDVASEVATRSVSQISLELQPNIQGDDTLPLECPMAQVGIADRCWNAQTFTFTASALCHKPLYFEDIQLERYGHSAGPFMQPLKSAAHFFVRVGLLPYQMGIHPPNECVYALGYYRPGDCAPWLRDPFPLSGRGLLYEAGFAVGAAAVIP